MTELSALNIKITGDAGDLKAAIGVATTELNKVSAAADNANIGTTRLAGGLGNIAKAAGNNSNVMSGMAQQLSQVGQQTMVTGNFVQALAIQLPDIGLAFGAVGAAAGLLAGIALPLLVSAFSSTSEKAVALAEATKELAEATEAFRVAAEAINLGIDQEEVSIVRELNKQMAELDRINKQWQSTDNLGAKQRLAEEAAAIKSTIAPLQSQLDAYRGARAELEKVKARAEASRAVIASMVGDVVDAKDAMVALVASAPSGGWLSGAIGDAATLATNLWDAAAAAAAANSLAPATSPRPGQRPMDLGDTSDGFGVGGVAGGGVGGGVNPTISELEAVQASLATQEQAQIDSFARQQETLNAALAQRLLTQQEYAALMEASQQQHSDKMAEIDVWRYGTGLQKAGAFLGEMANVFAAGNDKMLKISRIAGAAQGLIDAYGAYLKALNAPGGMTPLQRLSMAGGVLAAGLKAVSAIKGGGGGGASGAAAVTAAASGPTEMRTANINFYGGFQPTQDTISMIASGLNDWLGDGGRLNVGQAS